MKRSLHQHLLLIVFICAALNYGTKISADIYRLASDDTNWRHEKEKYFYCRLEQQVPLFGSIAIEAAPGHQLSIELISPLLAQIPKEVKLYVKPIPWGKSVYTRSARKTATIPVTSLEQLSDIKQQGLKLKVSANALHFFKELNSHSLLTAVITAAHKPADHPEGQIEVIIPTVGILPTLKEISDCVMDLLPRNFNELQNYNLYFNSGQKRPGTKQRQWLADTVRYLMADKSVNKITIDGHSDSTTFKQTNNTMSRLKNLELSKERALNVSRQLKRYINQANITRPLIIAVRHHGERYPIADNSTAKGRALNRRVEISLQRGSTATLPEPSNTTSNKPASQTDHDTKTESAPAKIEVINSMKH